MEKNQNSITNVFVLILENHSFDHLLGFSGIPGIDGLTGNESNSYGGKTIKVSKPAIDPMPTDPGHEFLDTLEQLCGQGTVNPFPPGPYPSINNSGFLANYATTTTEGPKPTPGEVGDIMHCCDSATEVPALSTLAREFAVCDHWFSSIPGPTWPNRFFAMAASSAGFDSSPSIEQIIKWELFDGFSFPNGSIFDRLKESDLQCRLYNDFHDQFSSNPDPIGGQFAIASALKGVDIFDVHHFKNFPDDLKGDYPYQFTFIEPNYGDILNDSYRGGSSQHPMDSLRAGDAMVAATYNAIRNSSVWETSLLIITYDEHGGFYDHVPPPPAPAPDDGSGDSLCNGFDFKQYGVRVPAVVISPLIARNSIDHSLYDHTSMIKTVENLHHLEPLTHRDAAANNVLHLLSLNNPRTDCPASLDVPAISGREIGAEELIAVDQEPLPESGNLIGFLHIAAKVEIELAAGKAEAKSIVNTRVKGLKTKGDAREYMKSVLEKLNNAREQRGM